MSCSLQDKNAYTLQEAIESINSLFENWNQDLPSFELIAEINKRIDSIDNSKQFYL